jgi:flagellar hook-associated protein 1 FlgK
VSLNSILGTASTGLYAAQTGINAVSDNVANVDTAGYARKVVNQVTSAQDGLGLGVSVAGVTRAANQYLQNASLNAAAKVGETGAVSNLLGQAQALFGDPSGPNNLFSSLNTVFGDFTAAANDPANSLNNIQTVNDAMQFLDQAQSISNQLVQLGAQADSQISSDVSQANQILAQISKLNISITQATAMGADATDAENAQSALINQLSSLIDVKVATTSSGAVTLSTTSGVSLVGQGGAATLGYTASAANSQVTITQPGVNESVNNLDLASGEIKGLLNLRNTLLPGVLDQLSEYVSGAVYAINAAHNASSAVPPPQTLTGTATGVDLQTAVAGFSGKTNVAIVDASGNLVQQVTIDFSAGTMSATGGWSGTFTPATFLAQLNTALGGTGTVSFTNGALSISASLAGDGVAIADDATTPSSRGGEGFSQYFGLNNLISSSTIANYQTGLTAADPSGFLAGQTLTLRVADASGSQITDIQVTTPGGSVQNLLDALNAPLGGVGLYGQFTLDSSGALSFTPNTPGGASISVVQDQTQSLSGGMSASQLFGIGAVARASRPNSFSVRADIAANPSLLSLATLNLNAAAAGQPVLSVGDGSGGLRLAGAASASVPFGAAGTMTATTMTISRYASLFGGQLGSGAAAAATASTNAQAVQTEADTRRSSVEGVNLDQELVNLTTYQQAYSASARLVTAAKDMFDTLLNMVGP